MGPSKPYRNSTEETENYLIEYSWDQNDRSKVLHT